MNKKPMKLGTLALLLLIISLCMTVLGVLTYSTAQADWRLAAEYGVMTSQQYARESMGQKFLQEADRTLKNGGRLEDLEGVILTENGWYEKAVTDGGKTTLHIGLAMTGPDSFQVVCWYTDTQWMPEEEIGGLWAG